MLLALAIPQAASLLRAHPAATEVFAHAGYFQGHEDEGSLGAGPLFGGAVMVPLWRWLSFDLDVSHGRAHREISPGEFRLRSTSVSPSLLYRWGGAKIYGFAGGGVGFQAGHATSRFASFTAAAEPGLPSTAGVSESSNSDSGLTFHGRAGFVAALSGHLLLRAELVVPFRYVAPNVAVQLGIGWRF